jgi:hypothetical protein
MTDMKDTPSRQETAETIGSSASERSSAPQLKLDVDVDVDVDDLDDASLIKQAEEQASMERLLVAARLLKQVKDKTLLEPKHLKVIKWADITEAGMKDLLTPPDQDGSAWKKQSESHGRRDFTVYYKVTENSQLQSRIDSVIESSLLVPIISALNESDLYETWMPSFKKPFKLGIQQTKKLKESGRGNQIIQVTVNMAWPFSTRETIQHAVAVDVIDEQGAIAIQVLTEDPKEDECIPEALPGVVRIDMSVSMLIRGCPPDHHLLAKSKHEYPTDEELIMISMKSSVDAHVSAVPVSLINFVTRTVFGRLWASLLQVAEDVRDGKRPQHKEAIAEKRELYDWVEERIDVMMEKVKNTSPREVKENQEDD